jgi:hypothetical protein
MKPLYVTIVVLLLIAMAVAVLAQAGPGPGGAQGGGRAGGGGRMPFMGGFGSPAMVFNEGFLYIVTGNVLYKIDVNQMQMVGWVWLQPPTLGAGAPGGAQ